jgi:hypothetical protein
MDRRNDMANQERIRKWVEALRSGEYMQAMGRLKRVVDITDHDTAVGYCCLGVVCDLSVKDGVGHWAGTAESPTVFRTESMAEEYHLPMPVADWLGLEVDTDGTSVEEGLEGSDAQALEVLINLNDGGADFTVIADKIEEVWLGQTG